MISHCEWETLVHVVLQKICSCVYLKYTFLGRLSEDAFECELIKPGDVQYYDKLEKEYSGFCPVALVTGQGFILPGTHDIKNTFPRGRKFAELKNI